MQQMSPKDPLESIVVEFSFLGELTEITSAVVTVGVIKGADPMPAAILVGPLAIVGPYVHQRVAGGVLGATYRFQCVASRGEDVYVRVGALPIQRD